MKRQGAGYADQFVDDELASVWEEEDFSAIKPVRKYKRSQGSAASFFKFVFLVVLLVGLVLRIYRVAIIYNRNCQIETLQATVESCQREYNNYNERYAFLYKNLLDKARDVAENELGMVKAGEEDIRTLSLGGNSVAVADAGE